MNDRLSAIFGSDMVWVELAQAREYDLCLDELC